MNWSRAKTILIIALLITNVFLILTYGEFHFRSDEFKDHKALAEFKDDVMKFAELEGLDAHANSIKVRFE